jgi:hypothetical protein
MNASFMDPYRELLARIGSQRLSVSIERAMELLIGTTSQNGTPGGGLIRVIRSGSERIISVPSPSSE